MNSLDLSRQALGFRASISAVAEFSWDTISQRVSGHRNQAAAAFLSASSRSFGCQWFCLAAVPSSAARYNRSLHRTCFGKPQHAGELQRCTAALLFLEFREFSVSPPLNFRDHGMQ